MARQATTRAASRGQGKTVGHGVQVRPVWVTSSPLRPPCPRVISETLSEPRRTPLALVCLRSCQEARGQRRSSRKFQASLTALTPTPPPALLGRLPTRTPVPWVCAAHRPPSPVRVLPGFVRLPLRPQRCSRPRTLTRGPRPWPEQVLWPLEGSGGSWSCPRGCLEGPAGRSPLQPRVYQTMQF